MTLQGWNFPITQSKNHSQIYCTITAERQIFWIRLSFGGRGKLLFTGKEEYFGDTVICRPLPSEAKGAYPQRHVCRQRSEGSLNRSGTVCRPFPQAPIPFHEKRDTLEYGDLPSAPQRSEGSQSGAARLPPAPHSPEIGVKKRPPNVCEYIWW